jgi:hypothetical protein
MALRMCLAGFWRKLALCTNETLTRGLEERRFLNLVVSCEAAWHGRVSTSWLFLIVRLVTRVSEAETPLNEPRSF